MESPLRGLAGLIRPVRQASDITLAQRGRVGVFFGFQNCSPIEDDIDLVEVFRQLGSSSCS